MMTKDKKNMCPLLLDPDRYYPDTIDLLKDNGALLYWLHCLEQLAVKFVDKVGYLKPDDKGAIERAQSCRQKFHDLVEKIKCDITCFNPLSIRTLLEYNEQLLQDNDFEDAWLLQKDHETAAAFLQFEGRLKEVDAIIDHYSKWEELAKGAVAGNMFDWGATAVTNMMEQTNSFGLVQAMDHIQRRPWFHDGLDQWIHRLEGSPYKKAIVFIDNSGVDFVLGILPFVRELLKQGTSVLLAANSAPAINDVTSRELELYLNIASEKCAVIKEAVVSNTLIAIENGQKGPCLDLRNLNEELCGQMSDADLIVLEGMGRAVHTNLNAKFTVDSLKLAVLKNEWLAKSLGAEQFAVLFAFEPVSQRT